MSTFRQTKDAKLLGTHPFKKDLNKSHKESPRTIDYLQVMNKYSHLIEQNQGNTSRKKERNNIKYKEFYMNTDFIKEKNKDMANIVPYKSSNNIDHNNENDNFFQFCRTDYENNEKEEDKKNFKYYTLKDFYLKKKTSSEIYNNFKTNFNTNSTNNKNTNIKIKNKNNGVEYNKINNILMSYNKNNNEKRRENIYCVQNNCNLYNNNNGDDNNLQKNNNNKIFNINIRKNISQKKISKKNNSTNSHSLNNIYINRTNKYFMKNNDDNNNNLNIISSSNEALNQKNKIQEKNQKIINSNILSEKIISIINLCQKYGNLLSNSINNLELNQNSISNNNDYLDELKYIISQFNNFIFSDKLNKYFNMDINLNLESNNNTKRIKNNKVISNFNLREFEPKTLNLTEKFRSKIENLKSEKYEMNNELILCKKKNKNLILEKEELNLINKKIIKENEELNREIKNRINLENKCHHQKNMIDKLKCQIETLTIDIRYKDNIINNLQQILEQIKIKSNLINFNNKTNDSDNIKINLTKNNNNNNNQAINNKRMSLNDLGKDYIIKGTNNVSDFLLDVNSYSIEKDIILPLNLKVNSFEDSKDQELFFNKKEDYSEIFLNNKEEIENNILQLKKNLNPNNNISNLKNKLLFNENEEPEILTKEMEKIDQDILNLKTKIKRIIAK